MIQLLSPRGKLRQAIDQAYLMDEEACVALLLPHAAASVETKAQVAAVAQNLVETARIQHSFVDEILQEYSLSSEDGIALICLAEALLRIPDKATRDKLIFDKLAPANWAEHVHAGNTWTVRALTTALALASRLLQAKTPFRQASQPTIRAAVKRAMDLISQHFIMGKTITQALKNSKPYEKEGYVFSYDMLGEAARSQQDAEKYFQAYEEAIRQAGKEVSDTRASHHQTPSISVKLSALHPRYEWAQREYVLKELTPKLLQLALLAKEHAIGLTVDAEEAERLDIALDIIEAVFTDQRLAGWEGFGVALQAYQKRAWAVIDWLAALARSQQQRLFVRLVKGAYWDTEIKRAQMLGLREYPIFTRKQSTDISYQACARKLLGLTDCLRPAFATHNAYTIAYILSIAGEHCEFEFQCLHGMGRALYQDLMEKEKLHCRIYAPVGHYKELLPYLMRRLLENGANNSFLHQIHNTQLSLADVVADPVAVAACWQEIRNPQIPLPEDIYGAQRKNSLGIDFTQYNEVSDLRHAMVSFSQQQWQAGEADDDEGKQAIYSPNDRDDCVGWVRESTSQQISDALTGAVDSAQAWSAQSVQTRCDCLIRAADLLQRRQAELMTLLVREGGKTLPDAMAELREAIDFCRYYAQQAALCLAQPVTLSGYTGEQNQLSLHGRGVMLCISPWNFPLAIFMGQVAACLVTGNAVIAKPAEQTPLIAQLAVSLLHEAGVPQAVLALVPGAGETVGRQLVADLRISGVLFTGSTDTARAINQILAQREGPIVPLIAETGGQNTLVMDSSAFLELAIDDVLVSAFGSAGQRCSALRVLFVQTEIADRVLEMLAGAMAELRVGYSGLLETDIGPVIDAPAREKLAAHSEYLQKIGRKIYQVSLPDACQKGIFFAPQAYEIDSLDQLSGEIFGPILHVIRYQDLDAVIHDINDTGYGLTFGIHSRITATQEKLQKAIRAGNCYINRNMTGAVVGLQPFGGEGLSGTGPKAGGPHYLYRLCNERTVTTNTAAIGGDVKLLDL